MEVKEFLDKYGCNSVSELTDTQVLEYFDSVMDYNGNVSISTKVRR